MKHVVSTKVRRTTKSAEQRRLDDEAFEAWCAPGWACEEQELAKLGPVAPWAAFSLRVAIARELAAGGWVRPLRDRLKRALSEERLEASIWWLADEPRLEGLRDLAERARAEGRERTPPLVSMARIAATGAELERLELEEPAVFALLAGHPKVKATTRGLLQAEQEAA